MTEAQFIEYLDKIRIPTDESIYDFSMKDIERSIEEFYFYILNLIKNQVNEDLISTTFKEELYNRREFNEGIIKELSLVIGNVNIKIHPAKFHRWIPGVKLVFYMSTEKLKEFQELHLWSNNIITYWDELKQRPEILNQNNMYRILTAMI